MAEELTLKWGSVKGWSNLSESSVELDLYRAEAKWILQFQVDFIRALYTGKVEG